MPSAIIDADISGRSTVEQGQLMQPFFAPRDGPFSFWNKYWHAEMVTEFHGERQDEAIIRVPATAVDNGLAFQMALNPDGPVKDLLHDCPVVIKRRWTDEDGVTRYDVMWGGFIKAPQHIGSAEDLEDSLLIHCTSVKKIMRDIICRGSWCYTGGDAGEIVFRDAHALHMNIGGRPSWIWTPSGMPMPALNPDWGIPEGFGPANPEDQETGRATYCTLGMLLTYLRNSYGPEVPDDLIGVETQAKQFYPGLKRLPQNFPFKFIWPSDFGTQVDEETVYRFDQGVGQNTQGKLGARKGRDIRFRNGHPLVGDGRSITGVLDTIFAEAGGYSWCLDYGPDQEEDDPVEVTLQCVPIRPVAAFQSQTIYRASGNQKAINVPVVTKFSYLESSEGVYSRMIGLGSAVKIERRIDSLSDTLIRGFTVEEFDEWRFDCVVQPGNNCNEETVRKALQLHPSILKRLLVTPSSNPAEGTEYEDDPIAPAVRPIWPFLLSYQGINAGDNANDIVPYPIRFEVNQDGTWYSSGVELDGLICWDNGYIEVEGFRDIGVATGDIPSEDNPRYGLLNWPGGVQYGVDGDGAMDVSLNEIRCTVAIPIDSTLEYSVMNPADSFINEDESLYEQVPDSPDAAKLDTAFTRTMAIDLKGLYELWLRVGSYPKPQAVGGVQFSDKLTVDDAVRSDFQLLRAHARKSLHQRNRLAREGYFEYGGWLAQLNPIGTQIDNIAPFDEDSDQLPFPLDCCVGGRRWTLKNMGSKDKPKWVAATQYFPV